MHNKNFHKAMVLVAAITGFSYQLNCSAALFEDVPVVEGVAAVGALAAIGVSIAVAAHNSSNNNQSNSSVVPPNYLPVEITNSTGIADNDHLYVLIKAVKLSDDGKTQTECFMNLSDKTTGKATCDQAVAGSVNNFQYSYPLSALHVDSSTNLPQIFIPQNTISGRIYFGINNQFDLYVNAATGKILDPDGFNPKDTNYYTLYDKVEFTYKKGEGNWVNPTAVDFFSIPIVVTQLGSKSGFTQAGLTGIRANILKSIQDIFTANDKTTSKMWNRLFLNYDSSNVLRVVSPGKAMIEIPPLGNPAFDPKYLDNTAAYGFNYTDNLWNYYATTFSNGNYLQVDCSEIASKFTLDNYMFKGTVVGNQFVFKNQTNTYTVTIDRPSNSRPFFAGAGDSFDATNNTPKAIIVRQLTSAFDVGLLPVANVIINKDYFIAHKTNDYYTINKALPDAGQKSGPWYDLYSKALHSFGAAQPIYTFAYDDALAQDGTLHDPNATTPSQLNIKLGDMRGVAIPQPCVDSSTYTVTPTMPKNTQVTYNGKVLKSNEAIATPVSVPFHVTLTNLKTTKSVQVDICIKHPWVHPYFYDATGVNIWPVQTGNKVQIDFPDNIGG